MLERILEGDSIIFRNGSVTVLTIAEKETDMGVDMQLQGELRSDVAHELADELTALATVGISVVVDFTGVTYITSTILDVFLSVQQLMDSMNKGSMVLKNMPTNVFQEFEKTGISELLLIET